MSVAADRPPVGCFAFGSRNFSLEGGDIGRFGGSPVKSSDSRRKRRTQSVCGDGSNPSCSSRARMKLSIALRGQPPCLTIGGCRRSGADERPMRLVPGSFRNPPFKHQFLGFRQRLIGGRRWHRLRGIGGLKFRRTSSLFAGWPGTIGIAPESAGSRAFSRTSNCTPPLRALPSRP